MDSNGTTSSGDNFCEPIIPGLPDDLALRCLAKVSHGYHGLLEVVCKRWQNLIRSSEYARFKAQEGWCGNWLFVLTEEQIGGPWNAYDPEADRWHPLPPIPWASSSQRHLGFSCISALPWNTLMDKMMGELHDQGKTISDIEASLRTIPLYPETIRAIKFAFSMGCDLRIVSDANLFFIKTILETHDLLHYFTEIKTNPAFVEESGRLRIFPFHPFTGDPHGCNLCPPNMCKGAIIDEIRSSIEDGWNKRFIYLGDGSGDFCPTLKLNERDSVLPRKEYPLWKLVQRNPDMVKAEVHEWSDAKDVEDLFLKLLKPAEMDMVNGDVHEWSDPKDVEDLLMKMLKPVEMDMVNGDVHEWSNPKDVEDLFVKLLKPAEMDMVEDEVHKWSDAKDGEDLFLKLLKPAEMDIAKGEVQGWSDIKDVEDLFVKFLKPSQTDYCL